MRDRPSIALALLAAISALLAFAPDALQSALAYDRAALQSGELWRLWTSHLVHVDGLHALSGVASMAALAWWWRGRPGPNVTCLLVAAPILSAGLYGVAPLMSHYRGLSGLLFCLLTCALLQPGAERARLSAVARHALAGALLLKLGWDAFQWATASPIVDGGAESVVAVEAHVLGALLGVVWLAYAATRQRGWRLHGWRLHGWRLRERASGTS